MSYWAHKNSSTLNNTLIFTREARSVITSTITKLIPALKQRSPLLESLTILVRSAENPNSIIYARHQSAYNKQENEHVLDINLAQINWPADPSIVSPASASALSILSNQPDVGCCIALNSPSTRLFALETTEEFAIRSRETACISNKLMIDDRPLHHLPNPHSKHCSEILLSRHYGALVSGAGMSDAVANLNLLLAAADIEYSLRAANIKAPVLSDAEVEFAVSHLSNTVAVEHTLEALLS